MNEQVLAIEKKLVEAKETLESLNESNFQDVIKRFDTIIAECNAKKQQIIDQFGRDEAKKILQITEKTSKQIEKTFDNLITETKNSLSAVASEISASKNKSKLTNYHGKL